jgi:hypothetical protein
LILNGGESFVDDDASTNSTSGSTASCARSRLLFAIAMSICRVANRTHLTVSDSVFYTGQVLTCPV